MPPPPIGTAVVLETPEVDRLIQNLCAEGYEVIGPSVRDEAIVQDRICSIQDLPQGIGEEQSPGKYRLMNRQDQAYFGFNLGPHSPKREFLVPNLTLLQIRRSKNGMQIQPNENCRPKLALFGIRPCEIAALKIQDRVLMEGAYVDNDYTNRRNDVLIVAVQCSQAAPTCFCTSMQTGPRVTRGFDLALTELLEPVHRFVVEIGSDKGSQRMADLHWEPWSEEDQSQVAEQTAKVISQMSRHVDKNNIKEVLQTNLDHPRWDEIATRCMGCANCTMVCPTCFCTSVQDSTDLSGEVATRTRTWDSCFTVDFGYVHGGSLRSSLAARYRQWLTHKFAHWEDQFGTSGCVGCGRCITWCPVGIDVTEELAAIQGDVL